MRVAAWIVLGWLAMTLQTAMAVHLAPGYVMPDPVVVVVVFLALRREPVSVALMALALGYLVGRQALAPTGLHEVAMVVTAVGVYIIAGHLAGNGTLFFAMICGVAVMSYHLLVYALLLVVRGHAGFATWATALLVPQALLTSVLALVSHRPMAALEARLSPRQHEGLTWD